MTRPSDVKPREGEQPGTPSSAIDAGSLLPEMRFTISPEIVEEYLASIDADRSLYSLDGRAIAPPNVLFVYQLAVLYRKYPPIQGIILTEQTWDFHAPIWADETTEIVADGKIVERFEKRGKQFMRWSADFRSSNGTKLATSTNTMYLPE
ncbi:MAG: hypothetical protein JWN27_1757 [Candidatus Eremiobacteraeota bacterium]|nr:hypothetical protein [Candidatus Eremiobacteraeota bacterium]